MSEKKVLEIIQVENFFEVHKKKASVGLLYLQWRGCSHDLQKDGRHWCRDGWDC